MKHENRDSMATRLSSRQLWDAWCSAPAGWAHSGLTKSMLGALLLIGLGAAAPATFADSNINVNFQATFDGVLKIYATENYEHVGSPLVDVEFSNGSNVNEAVTSSSHDLAKVIQRARPAGGRASLDIDSAVVVADAESGGYSSPNLGDFLLSTVGAGSTVYEPLLSSALASAFLEVDMNEYLSSGGGHSVPAAGSTINFVNGQCSIPGIFAGSEPFLFDPSVGLVNPSPFTGSLDVIGVTSIAAIPEPSSLALLALGAVASLRRRRKA
jgi:hypothetical protein